MDASLSLPATPAPRLPSMIERAAAKGYGVRTEVRTDVLESKVDPVKREQIRKAANEFESNFVSQMLGHMFDGIEVDDNFGGGRGEEMFRPMLIEQFGKQITQRGGLGIANQVYHELLRAQEASHG